MGEKSEIFKLNIFYHVIAFFIHTCFHINNFDIIRSLLSIKEKTQSSQSFNSDVRDYASDTSIREIERLGRCGGVDIHFLYRKPDLYGAECRGRRDLAASSIYRRRSPHSKNKKQPSQKDSIEFKEKYGGVSLMLRGRDARAADGGRGMAWVGGHRG